jgi:hypothetical protein
VDLLLGDPSKAHAKLGWRHETSFEALVDEMMASDLAAAPRCRGEPGTPRSGRASERPNRLGARSSLGPEALALHVLVEVGHELAVAV